MCNNGHSGLEPRTQTYFLVEFCGVQCNVVCCNVIPQMCKQFTGVFSKWFLIFSGSLYILIREFYMSVYTTPVVEIKSTVVYI